jgi:hypothetical protein
MPAYELQFGHKLNPGTDELFFMKFSADDMLFKLNPKLYVRHATGHFSKF